MHLYLPVTLVQVTLSGWQGLEQRLELPSRHLSWAWVLDNFCEGFCKVFKFLFRPFSSSSCWGGGLCQFTCPPRSTQCPNICGYVSVVNASGFTCLSWPCCCTFSPKYQWVEIFWKNGQTLVKKFRLQKGRFVRWCFVHYSSNADKGWCGDLCGHSDPVGHCLCLHSGRRTHSRDLDGFRSNSLDDFGRIHRVCSVWVLYTSSFAKKSRSTLTTN